MILAQRFGVRLREERSGKCLTQSDIAADLGVNRSYVSEVESGKRNLTFEQAERIAAAVHLSALDLFRPSPGTDLCACPPVQGEHQ